MNRDRFRFLACSHLETDLLIGVPHDRYSEGIEHSALKEIERLRTVLENYASGHPEFIESLVPLPRNSPAAPEIELMLRCGAETGTGPMSCVAGLFAEQVGEHLASRYGLEEVLVENGGDLFIMNPSPVTAVIHAGASPLSGQLGLEIPPGTWGICTSSGTVGHSFSFGKADAVTVVAEEAPLADAWATALANLVNLPEDIEKVMNKVAEIPEILGCVAIMHDRLAIRGQFELKPLS